MKLLMIFDSVYDVYYSLGSKPSSATITFQNMHILPSQQTIALTREIGEALAF